jgi:hypothetical protein
VEVVVEEGIGLGDRGLGRIRAGQGVEHHEVVDDALVAHGGDVVAGGPELGGVGLALVPQDVGLVGDDQSLGQPLELVEAGPQR